MSDRHNGYFIVLEKDIKDEDSKYIINAIKMIKGVLDVLPNMKDVHDDLAYTRIKSELIEKLISEL